MKFILFTLIATIFLLSTEQCNAQKMSKEAKQLFQFISELEGQTLSGQHCYNTEPDRYYDEAHRITGKYPAIWGGDFYWDNGDVDPGYQLVKDAIKKYEDGSIITLMWHVGRPIDSAPYGWKSSVQNTITDENWNDLITPGTLVHNQWLQQVDALAVHLKVLQSKNIPILWRPYHEMNGVWFWWGNRKGKNGYQALWKMLHDRLCKHHNINNLIWVWNANAPRDIPKDQAFDYADFYPGHKYVDILATDVYHFDYEQKDYQQLLDLADGKPIALGEVGQLPVPHILEAQPEWKWFMVWSGWLETANTEEGIKNIYELPQIITREELK